MLIDHIEIYVPNQQVASQRYGKVLGFSPAERFLDWADAGPLMISNNNGAQMIALFEGPPQGTDPVRGLRRLAFRVSGDAFIEFIRSSSDWSDPPLGVEDIQDHSKSISVYFTDPYGNPLEVTTYDDAIAREFLESTTFGPRNDSN